MTMDTSKVLRLSRKLQRIFWKRRKIKSIAPATENDFRHVTNLVWMSRSATPATRNAATQRWKHPKVTPFAELTVGTAIAALSANELLRTVANGCERLRTVADGYGRLQTFANGCAPSSEHTLNPQTHRVKREPLLRIGEKNMPNSRTLYSQKPGTVITKRWNATVSGRRPCASGLHLFCKALV